MTVLWFVLRGHLRLTHDGGCSVARVGELLVTKSTGAACIECLPDASSGHETLHLVIATHALLRILHWDLRTGYRASTSDRGLAIAQRLLLEVFDAAGTDGLPERIAHHLLDTALAVLRDSLDARLASRTGPVPASRRRLADVLRYIETHLSDPSLSATKVAGACDISTRYMAKLLKDEGTTYSALLWGKRLQAASHWLREQRPGKVFVLEVASRAGFRSAAHFSRQFRRAYRMSPVTYRDAPASALTEAPRQQAALLQLGDPVSQAGFAVATVTEAGLA